MNAIKPARLAVLLSGSGTTLQNIIDLIEAGELSAKIEVVIGSKPSAFGLERARKHNIPAVCVHKKKYENNEAFGLAVHEELAKYDMDLIVLAGFMHIFPIGEYRDRVMNVHPALIPAFCGKGFYGHHVHEAVYKAGVKITGCTVHFADDVYDHGPIILQGAVEVDDDDDPDSIAEKVMSKERELYPKAIQLFAEGRLKIEGRKVKIKR